MVNIRNYICTATCAVLLLFLAGCNTDAWQSSLDRNTAAFADQAGGKVDPDHLYMTGVQVTLNVKVPDAGKVRAVAFRNQEAYIFHEIYVTADTTYSIVAPQGFDTRIQLVFNDNVLVENREVILTGNLQETYTVSFSKLSAAPHRLMQEDEDPEKNSLTNVSVKNNLEGPTHYSYFSGEVWKMVSDELPERVDAMYSGHVTNYEFYNPQKVSLALVMGNNSGTIKRILGYYYHSPGTYDDITFCDVAEVNYHNYVDGLRSVQFMRKGSNVWEDMDFTSTYKTEMYNGFVNIDSVRGLTFSSKPIPRGMMVGIYYRFNSANQTQRQHLINLGFPSDRLPANFMEMNFSNRQFNVDQRHRSVVLQHDGLTYLGLEDLNSEGDFDCNDLIMRMTPDSVYETLIELDERIDTLASAQPLRWTLAFEDVYRDADFDYNDVVLRIVPNYKAETAEVWVSAYGSDRDMMLYYQSKEGIKELCRLQSLFRGQTFVNTKQGQNYISPVQVATIAWPSTRTAYENAEQLYVTISRGDCPDGCEDLLALRANPGQAPSAILVAEYWQWPMEAISIFREYGLFADWSRRQTEMQYWKWYWK